MACNALAGSDGMISHSTRHATMFFCLAVEPGTTEMAGRFIQVRLTLSSLGSVHTSASAELYLAVLANMCNPGNWTARHSLSEGWRGHDV